MTRIREEEEAESLVSAKDERKSEPKVKVTQFRYVNIAWLSVCLMVSLDFLKT